MNTPNNKRRRESIEKLEKVFLELLQHKELSEISVSELCKGAEINRSTFYANFVDIYALADRVKEHLQEDLAELYAEEIASGHSSYDYLKLLYHICENQIFYNTYFKLGYDNSHEILRYDTEAAERMFGGKLMEYHLVFFKSGFNAIIKLWLSRGCRETPEEIKEVLESEYRGRQI